MGRLNKPAKPGYVYRSPRRTNAEDLTPNLQEDVVASDRADKERIRRGLNTDRIQNPANRRRAQEAGGRATMRSLGRLGGVGVAYEAGKRVGEELDRRVPAVGKAADALIEKSGVGALARKGAVPPGRVELTDEAKQRLSKPRKDSDDNGYAKGGSVGSAAKRADGCAQRGHTKGRFV